MNVKLKIGLVFLALSILLLGIKVDDEFDDSTLFVKYKPSFQMYFKSPLGMQDLPANYPKELRAEENTYNQFVRDKHWSDQPFFDVSISAILILGTFYFMFMGIKNQIHFTKFYQN
ncbi:hypothetical protein [Flavobacterium tegetincola]|uniref:hypothetical protein n=1 Tax=Flavobacterium tegetincola TaxID=150172 RepID=UPI00040E1745|nr:hypothetical protein [Flavobacterium tegetincola]